MNETKRMEERYGRPTLILMVILVAPAFVLDSHPANAKVILQEVQQQILSFYNNLLRKKIVFILKHAI